MHGPHAAIVRAPRLRADRAAVRRRASAAVRALSRRVRKPRFRASARACTRPHGNRMQPEIRTCRPSASCRQPAPPGRGVRRSQPPSRRRVRHRRLPEAPVRRRKQPHAHGPSVRCRAMLRFCERRIRPLRSPGCRNPFRARPLRPDRPVRPSGGNSVKYFRNSVRAAGGSGLIFVP